MDKNQLLLAVLATAGTAIAFVVAWVGVKYRALVVSKIENEAVEGILLRLGSFVTTVVLELKQTVVDDLKEADKWDLAAAKKVRDEALAKIKSYLGPEGLRALATVLGLGIDVEKYLVSSIEAEVASTKEG